MNSYHIVLASNSPRRKELLAGLGLPFEVRVLQDIDESYPDNLPVSEVALYIAGKKADAYRASLADDELVITADTVVIVGDEIHYYITHYKPFDKAGAYGIQEWIGYIGVTGLHGSYYNVMGLPVQRIYETLQQID